MGAWCLGAQHRYHFQHQHQYPARERTMHQTMEHPAQQIMVDQMMQHPAQRVMVDQTRQLRPMVEIMQVPATTGSTMVRLYDLPRR